MNSADWEHWAEVFRAGALRGQGDDMSGPGQQGAAILEAMARKCDEHAADARRVGR
jgi:hypothetical protein